MLIFMALFMGKVIGIVGMSQLAHVAGAKRPDGVGLSELLVVACVAAIGLTVALFVTGEAFQADVRPHHQHFLSLNTRLCVPTYRSLILKCRAVCVTGGAGA